MKRTKHHNKRRLPAAMLIQCLWRMEVGRRDGAKELLDIQNAEANRKSAANGVTPNGQLQVEEVERSKRMLGAMQSLRRLKYLACRFSLFSGQNGKKLLSPTLPFFRKAFKSAMKPYDVRDVVESFGAGQARVAKQFTYSEES